MLKKPFIILLVLGLIIVSGCSSTSTSSSSNKDVSVSKEVQGAKANKTNIKFLMGAAQGTWTPIAQAMAHDLQAKFPELSINVEPGGGSANVEAIQTGKADIGMVFTTSAYDGWEGNAPFKNKTDKIRQLGVLFPMHLYMVVPGNSTIQSLQDIKGKKVNIGRRGSSTELIGLIILQELGLSDKDLKIERLGEEDAFRSMQDGHIDLIIQFGATPYPPLLDMSATKEVRLLSISNELSAKLQKRNLGLISTTLSAKHYPKVLKNGIQTLSSSVDLIINANVDDKVVEKLVKGLHEIQPALKQNFSFMQAMEPKDIAADIGIPFHESAKKYYQAQGWLK